MSSPSSSSTILKHITPDAEFLITNMARVSNPANQDNTDTSANLIRYLIKHKHWSPFEMVSMCVEINTQRDIAAQILRHRSFTFQEFSQRYANASELGYTLPQLRGQDPNNRQSSLLVEYPQDLYDRVEAYLNYGQRFYGELLQLGVAKECARRLLPMCQNTRMYMTGSIRSWLHYCDVRCGPETQLEHRLIAEQVKVIIKEMLPNVYEAMWPTWVAPPVHFNIAPPLTFWGRVKEAWRSFIDG